MRKFCLFLILSVPLFLLAGCAGVSAPASEEGADTDADANVATPPDVLPPLDGASTGVVPQKEGLPLPVSYFPEIWAYLTEGREEYFNGTYPITDLGYFGAEFNSYGELSHVPSRRSFSASTGRNFKGRVHLVVACNSASLTHFILQPDSQARKVAIRELVAATSAYDGLQLDFELVLPRDGDAYKSFIAELRKKLPGKVLSVALPAKMRDGTRGQYDYTAIAALVDRVLVMAYDEHWSGGPAGPIASTSWCSSIADYALQTIGKNKLIMGLPFYGRSWGDNVNRAWYYSGVDRIKQENNVSKIQRDDSVPWFSYQTTITVDTYYEDAHSLSAKLQMYKSKGVKAVGFWTLGQETPEAWDIIALQAK
jgi:spore germination protein YaaH